VRERRAGSRLGSPSRRSTVRCSPPRAAGLRATVAARRAARRSSPAVSEALGVRGDRVHDAAVKPPRERLARERLAR
jgi:hypothetical protein